MTKKHNFEYFSLDHLGNLGSSARLHCQAAKFATSDSGLALVSDTPDFTDPCKI